MILVYQCMAPYIDHLFRAVSAHEPVVGIEVRLSEWGYLFNRRGLLRAEPYPVVQIDLPRGYGRKFFWVARSRLRNARKWSEDRFGEEVRAVVFTIPHLAPLAQDFADVTRAYYVSDDFRGYGWGERFVARRERQMVACVDHVFCVSNMLRERFISEYGVPEDRCHLSPNATTAGSLLSGPLAEAAPLPCQADGISRPVAGVIGNLGANTDFCLLLDVARRTDWLQWLLVGPLSKCKSREQDSARASLLALRQVNHVGWQPYESLQAFSRSFDVAVMPYKKGAVTYYGSPARLYDHLAATRPVVSTRACAQCEEYASVMHLVDNAQQMCGILTNLRAQGFEDGLDEARRKLSKTNTWADRATRMLSIIGGRACTSASETGTNALSCRTQGQGRSRMLRVGK